MTFSSQKSSAVCAMMPLRDIVIFPHMVVPLFVGRQKSIRSVEKALEDNREIFLCTQRDASIDQPSRETLYQIGTLAAILQTLKLPDGSIKVLVEGRMRCQLQEYLPIDEFFSARIETVDEILEDTQETGALMGLIVGGFDGYMKLNKRLSKEVLGTAASIKDPSKLADVLAPQLQLSLEQKQELLDDNSIQKIIRSTIPFDSADSCCDNYTLILFRIAQIIEIIFFFLLIASSLNVTCLAAGVTIYFYNTEKRNREYFVYRESN
jgi:ATP-dependent Lon protease